MMSRPEMRTPTSAKVGAAEVSKGIASLHYQLGTIDATEIAAVRLARRFGISPCLARVVAELAQFGGRMA